MVRVTKSAIQIITIALTSATAVFGQEPVVKILTEFGLMEPGDMRARLIVFALLAATAALLIFMSEQVFQPGINPIKFFIFVPVCIVCFLGALYDVVTSFLGISDFFFGEKFDWFFFVMVVVIISVMYILLFSFQLYLDGRMQDYLEVEYSINTSIILTAYIFLFSIILLVDLVTSWIGLVAMSERLSADSSELRTQVAFAIMSIFLSICTIAFPKIGQIIAGQNVSNSVTVVSDP